MSNKAVILFSDESDYTNSSDKKAINKETSKNIFKQPNDTVSTQFTDFENNQKGETKVSPLTMGDDIEMELETDTSLDSPMEEEAEDLHSKVVREYGSKIIDNLKKKQIKMTGDFERHEIKNSHRKQMIVWMDEVLEIFESPLETKNVSSYLIYSYLDIFHCS